MITLIRKEKVPVPVLTQKLKQQSMIFSKSDNLVPPCWRYLTRFEENSVPLDQQRPRQVNQLPISSIYISFLRCTVSDPYSLYTDPDPASNLNTDLAPGFFRTVILPEINLFLHMLNRIVQKHGGCEKYYRYISLRPKGANCTQYRDIL